LKIGICKGFLGKVPPHPQPPKKEEKRWKYLVSAKLLFSTFEEGISFRLV
jgi:hypothetical protein